MCVWAPPAPFCGSCWPRGTKGGSDRLRTLAQADDYTGGLSQVGWERRFRVFLAPPRPPFPPTPLGCAVPSPPGLSLCLVSICWRLTHACHFHYFVILFLVVFLESHFLFQIFQTVQVTPASENASPLRCGCRQRAAMASGDTYGGLTRALHPPPLACEPREWLPWCPFCRRGARGPGGAGQPQGWGLAGPDSSAHPVLLTGSWEPGPGGQARSVPLLPPQDQGLRRGGAGRGAGVEGGRGWHTPQRAL